MKIGYSFWGYLGDTKYDRFGDIASTPDGNAFYSWSVINKLQEDGHEVYTLMPDRDGVVKTDHLFDGWCKEQRKRCYNKSVNIWNHNNYEKIYDMAIHSDIAKGSPSFSPYDSELYKFLEKMLDRIDIVLHEWRMPIDGRNFNVKDKTLYQPDYDIQFCILRYFESHPEKKLIIFDLDYKLNRYILTNLKNGGNNVYVFELGYKWNEFPNARHVEIPFDFRYMNEFNPGEIVPYNNLVYVGNRYERDWCIDKYIPTEIRDVVVYGNWLEGGRDSQDKWPNIKFGKRVQTSHMRSIYANSKATILLAKKEYLENEFMTARILEAVFYGCVPLFIEEYGRETIEKYAGDLAPYLTVKNKADVIDCVYALEDNSLREKVINKLREHLKFMDVSNFVEKIYEVYNSGLF